ncbi:YqhA family protein [Pollutibacter soli]|uniref:YqhA family protein n=1 Tax=Pollutibacter soli TaxID=3034157 RepID=UPI003013F4ED
MLRNLLKIRYVYVIGVFFTLINSIVFMILGVTHSVKGYIGFIKQMNGHTEGRPGLELLHGLDMFLVSLVFLVFGLGILKIFTHYHQENDELPNWLKIDNFSELKILLWETILITLVVLSVAKVVAHEAEPNWTLLIYPAIIFILTASLFLVRSQKH